jgi:serine/threonine protein kinase
MLPMLIDRYTIKKEIARGGMATVYLAFDPYEDQEIALKILPPEFLHDPNFKERFHQEAALLTSLRDPGIVEVYRFGEDKGLPYLAMRLMKGGTLIDQLSKGPLSLNQAARIIKRLAPALDKAHQQNVIHRDLKPGNILFDTEGNPYLADFGIAKISGKNITKNLIMGTPEYMSPEQFRGVELNGKSDIYSLGVVLFEMLTGTKPYEAPDAVSLGMKHVEEPIPSLLERRPDLPEACEGIIRRALAKKPACRYATALELSEAVSSLLLPPKAANTVNLGLRKNISSAETKRLPELRLVPSEEGNARVGGPSETTEKPPQDSPASAPKQSRRTVPRSSLWGGLALMWIVALYAIYTNPNGSNAEQGTAKSPPLLSEKAPVLILEKPKREDSPPSAEDCTIPIDSNGNFFQCPDQSIYDKAEKLFWAEKDNGINITYDNAATYAKKYKSGAWRIPTVQELKSLQAAKITSQQNGPIQLTSCCLWVSDNKLPKGVELYFDCLKEKTCSGSSWAFYLYFLDGVGRDPRFDSSDSRVLPVRSSKE